ncbi:MAG: fatty acid desaturase [Betaproteobacteria bacterium]|nr:MAG: fatty acid desaturase [Betaproteobacteria bacterium]
MGMEGTDAPRIPDRLNVALVFGVQSAAIGLIWCAARVEGVAVLALGIAFSFLLLTNYALLHEAAHDHLHSSRVGNALLGALAGSLFPASMSMVRVTHAIHHCYNRTDEEIFDLYHPRDNMLRKYVQWYTPLLGFFWLLVPLGSVLFGVFPGLLRTRLARISTTTKFMHEYFDALAVRRVRLELVFICVYWTAIWHLLALDWGTLAVFYGCVAFNWSTRQYVSHAYTARDVVNGALNPGCRGLRCPQRVGGAPRRWTTRASTSACGERACSRFQSPRPRRCRGSSDRRAALRQVCRRTDAGG